MALMANLLTPQQHTVHTVFAAFPQSLQILNYSKTSIFKIQNKVKLVLLPQLQLLVLILVQ